VKLGKREIDGLCCKPGQRERLVFDDGCPGLGIRVACAGRKTFFLQYRSASGRVRRAKIGRYGALTLVEARKEARKLRVRVDRGGDPVAEDKARKAADRQRETAQAFTFAALIDRWEREWLVRRRPGYRREATRSLRVNLAALAGLPAAAIDAATVRREIDHIVHRPAQRRGSKPKTSGQARAKKTGKKAFSSPAILGETTARRTRAYGAAMYGWAIREEVEGGLITFNPFAAVRRKGQEAARERVLTDAEVGEVWRASSVLGWPWGPYFRLLLLTLQREREVAGLSWFELSPDLALWEIRSDRTKNGKPHLVHLAEPARALLRAAPRKPGSFLVFTTTGSTPISGFGNAKRRLVEEILAERKRLAAEAGDGRPVDLQVTWRLHDFRRTGATGIRRLGGHWEVADRILNHTQGVIRGVAAVYQRFDFLPERESALNMWALHVLAVAEGTAPGTNVIELRRGGAVETA
jgi:hypothetical protein